MNLIPEEARKAIYDASRKPPEGYEVKKQDQEQNDSNKGGPRSQVSVSSYIVSKIKKKNLACDENNYEIGSIIKILAICTHKKIIGPKMASWRC